MIWFMVALICALAAFAESMRVRQYWMAGSMAISAGFCIFGILTS